MLTFERGERERGREDTHTGVEDGLLERPQDVGVDLCRLRLHSVRRAGCVSQSLTLSCGPYCP